MARFSISVSPKASAILETPVTPLTAYTTFHVFVSFYVSVKHVYPGSVRN